MSVITFIGFKPKLHKVEAHLRRVVMSQDEIDKVGG